MEEIKIDIELEEILKRFSHSSFDYPVANFTNSGKNCVFNTRFADIIQDWDYIRFFNSSEYIVIMKGNPHNGYKMNKNHTLCSIPRDIYNTKILKDGYYRIFKYKDGYAIKKYEPIGDA